MSSLANLIHVKPGQVLNPKGRPLGSRARFSEKYCDDLLEVWCDGGKDALRRVMDKDPSTFVRVAASLIPKQSAHIRANVSANRSLEQIDRDMMQVLEAKGYKVIAPGGNEAAGEGLERGVVGVAQGNESLPTNISEADNSRLSYTVISEQPVSEPVDATFKDVPGG